MSITLMESAFFLHDYVKHYPFVADTNFHYGLKEVVQLAKTENKVVVISPKYEPPLIFYLFYNHFSPARFQTLLREGILYRPIGKDLNLEGYQLGEESVYFAFVSNLNAANLYPVKGVYFITYNEAVVIYGEQVKSIAPVIKSPSGLPLYYRIEVN